MKFHGIEKGDKVCIYMQHIPELIFSMLACIRIGAVHVVINSLFSADALYARIVDCNCKMIVTQDYGVKYNDNDVKINIKSNVDNALLNKSNIKSVEKVIVVKRFNRPINM